ncbi:hypothetical protein O181_120660 [Austropuccinia psidii MF-1]|uniref:Uncharacterized protein n=1 Tax=Austropuccinia psidii MF-1 TaxID=1389203 RepID=A0A9Q3KKM4_9BASI|nr:hypothetical protein [Austropuccinia psidii MF-1]
MLPSNGMPTFNLQTYSKNPDPRPADPIACHIPQLYNLPPTLNSVKIDNKPSTGACLQSAPLTTTSNNLSNSKGGNPTIKALKANFLYYFHLFDYEMNNLHDHMEKFFLNCSCSNISFQQEYQIIQNLVQSCMHWYRHIIELVFLF